MQLQRFKIVCPSLSKIAQRFVLCSMDVQETGKETNHVLQWLDLHGRSSLVSSCVRNPLTTITLSLQVNLWIKCKTAWYLEKHLRRHKFYHTWLPENTAQHLRTHPRSVGTRHLPKSFVFVYLTKLWLTLYHKLFLSTLKQMAEGYGLVDTMFCDRFFLPFAGFMFQWLSLGEHCKELQSHLPLCLLQSTTQKWLLHIYVADSINCTRQVSC